MRLTLMSAAALTALFATPLLAQPAQGARPVVMM